MPNTVTATALPEVLLFEPKLLGDDRGFFFESFNERAFQQADCLDVNSVQDNHRKFNQDGLHGLHRQIKIRRASWQGVNQGTVSDSAVDLRCSSSDFGKWVGIELSPGNKRHPSIPSGFIHCSLVMTELVEFLHKTTNYWHPEHERSLLRSDPLPNIT